MKIRFTGEIEFPGEAPDDRGSVDAWIMNSLEVALNEVNTLERLKISWEEVEPI